METILQWDYFLFELINGQWHNAFLDWLMPMWREKAFWAPLYLFLFVWLVQKHGEATAAVVIFAILTIVLSDQLSSTIIKPFFERFRPCQTEALSYQVRLLIPHCGSGYSFVSSHATNHFAIATCLSMVFFPHFRWVVPLGFLWAASISYGQVYIGVHFPVDVIGGALLGIFIGSITGFGAYYFVHRSGKNKV